MSLIYRPARAEDLPKTDALVVSSINDLTERHGFGPMASPSVPDFQLFSLQDDPDGLWIAEDGGKILGFAWSWTCGNLWFLAQLFVDPAEQGRGVGDELLQFTLQHAQKSGAVHRALITFAFNRVSQGLYIRHGLYPKMPIYFFGVARERVMANVPVSQLRSVRIENIAAHRDNLVMIDALAIGVTREKHHRYLLDSPEITGFMLHAGGECVGYAYVSSSGHIGPLAVARADLLSDALTAALKLASDHSTEKITAFVPGTCHKALKTAVDQGMRITMPMLLMASPGYGSWDQYLPRNPGFM